jgi:hypothetical protein
MNIPKRKLRGFPDEKLFPLIKPGNTPCLEIRQKDIEYKLHIAGKHVLKMMVKLLLNTIIMTDPKPAQTLCFKDCSVI